ncbi:MAG: hypothetical protein Q9227_004120 [Pyrenula ochraceoflavens]
MKHFVTFGDSYSQTGFDSNATLADPSNILGNPPYPGWTTDGGPNWIDYLIATYNKSTTLSYNFAYGGATVDSALVEPYDPSVISLVGQVYEFSNSIADKPAEAPWTSEDTLFGTWIGVNDVGMSWWLSNETDVLNAVFDQLFDQVQILYDAGGRNFVFLNVPRKLPIPSATIPSEIVAFPGCHFLTLAWNIATDRSPYAISLGASSGLAPIISIWNDELVSRTSDFSASHSDASATVVDTQAPFNKVLDADATAAACYNADGVTCAWWNDYHPAMAIHNAVAQAVAAAEPDFFTG